MQVWKGKKKQYDLWSEKVLAKAESKGYSTMMLHKKDQKGFDVVPATEVVVLKTEIDTNILKLDELNK